MKNRKILQFCKPQSEKPQNFSILQASKRKTAKFFNSASPCAKSHRIFQYPAPQATKRGQDAIPTHALTEIAKTPEKPGAIFSLARRRAAMRPSPVETT